MIHRLSELARWKGPLCSFSLTTSLYRGRNQGPERDSSLSYNTQQVLEYSRLVSPSHLPRVSWLLNGKQSTACLIPWTKSQLFWTFNRKHSLISGPCGFLFSPKEAKLSFEKIKRLTTSWIPISFFPTIFKDYRVQPPFCHMFWLGMEGLEVLFS